MDRHYRIFVRICIGTVLLTGMVWVMLASGIPVDADRAALLAFAMVVTSLFLW